MTLRSSRLLMGLILTAIAARILLFVYLAIAHPESFVARDTRSYVAPISDLLTRGSFSVAGAPEVFRTPGYTLFLLPFWFAFGTTASSLAVLTQVGLSVVLGFATFRLAALTDTSNRGRAAAAAALIIVLFDPTVFAQQYRLLSDTLFALILTGAVFLLVRFLQSQRASLILASSMLFAIAAYVRPISLYLPFILALAGLVVVARSRSWRLGLYGLAALALYSTTVGAWVVRNEHEADVAAFATVSHLNIYEYIGAAVLARAEHRGWQEVRRELGELWEDESLSPAQALDSAKAASLAVFRQHPKELAIVVTRGALTNALDPGSGELVNLLGLREAGSGLIYKYQDMSTREFISYLLRYERPLLIATGFGLVWLLGFWVLAAIGAIRGRRQLGSVHWISVICILYFVGTAAGPNANARFRLPAIPFMAVLAGAGFVSLPTRQGNHEGKPEVDQPLTH